LFMAGMAMPADIKRAFISELNQSIISLWIN